MSKKVNKKNVKIDNAIRNFLLNEEFIFNPTFVKDYMQEFSKNTNEKINQLSGDNVESVISDEDRYNNLENLKNSILIMKKYLESEFKITDFKDGVIYFKNMENIENRLTMSDFFSQTINQIDETKLQNIILKFNPEVEMVVPILQDVANKIVEDKLHI